MAKDIFHQALRKALEDDGWLITEDPYRIKVMDTNYEVDLGAEKVVAAERNGIKIAVEIKSFSGLSFAYEFHGALGQYLNYAAFMELQEPDRKLFLAVTQFVFDKYFQLPSIKFIVNKYNVKIIVFEPLSQEICKWLPK